jgi:PASTA domain
MMSVRAKKRRRLAATVALLCALVTCCAVAVAPAAAEEGDSAPIRPISERGFSFPDIQGPTAPEEYPLQYAELGPELTMRQVDDQTIVLEYPKYGVEAGSIKAEPAHAADGAAVPTSVRLSEDEEGFVVTEIVRHRAGNPAAGDAPFVYPVSGGSGWLGGFFTSVVELNEPRSTTSAEPTVPAMPTPCTVPSLHDLSLRAAKARLGAAHCSMGQVRLATGATAAKGEVAKQFRPAGTELAAGTPVAVKLVAPRSL